MIEESIKTRDHTENLLKYLNYQINIEDKTIYLVGQKKMIAKDISVPSDISSAAFFIVAALITNKSDVILKYLQTKGPRADAKTVVSLRIL